MPKIMEVLGPLREHTVYTNLRRQFYELLGNPKFSKPSFHNLDNKLAKYLNFRNGFFIEAGANNGYLQSNTYYLEKILGWRGVLVEGIPDLYKECRKSRRRSRVYNCALVAPDYNQPTVEMHFADLMSLVAGARKSSEAEAQHISRGMSLQSIEKSYRIQVPARTLESILDELPQPVNIDFLSLDVEGYEFNVLQGLNLQKYQPTYILVEATFFDEVNGLLSEQYEMIEQMTHHDYLYKLKST